MQRYTRQMILPGFGANAQEKIFQSKVLVVGAGGLGVPVLQYLTAAGIGQIGIADGDIVELTNLQRQVLFDETNVGENKAQVAKQKLALHNSAIQFNAYDFFLDQHNIFDLLEKYHIVVDCTDNFSTRYLLNDVCCLLKKPLVFASIFRYEAQLSVFHYGQTPYNLRDVFAEIPDQKLVPNCNEAGVIGTLAGMAGCLQANETIKIITGIGAVNTGKLLLYNSLDNTSMQISITKNPNIFLPQAKAAILNKNYGFACTNYQLIENLAQLQEILSQKSSVLIDVREANELPKITRFPVLEIPLSSLHAQQHQFKNYQNLIFICQSGVRSKKAIHLLYDNLHSKICFSVKQGIDILNHGKT